MRDDLYTPRDARAADRALRPAAGSLGGRTPRWLADAGDDRYFGTGAFNTTTLGFGSAVSNGSNDIGHEIDAVVSLRLVQGVVLSGGYAVLLGGAVFPGPERDTDFGFVQVSLRY